MTAPTLSDFIDLFGADPIRVEAAGWQYGAHFLLQNADRRFEVLVAPMDAELGFEFVDESTNEAMVRLTSVTQWRFHTAGEKRCLTVAAYSHGVLAMTLSIGPTIEVLIQMKL